MIVGEELVNTARRPVWVPLLVARSDARSAFGSQRRIRAALLRHSRNFHRRSGEPA